MVCGALHPVSLASVRNPLLIGVQQKLQSWAARAGGNASQWADTVLTPRAADEGVSGGSGPLADSQYLSGFDSQFVDDPALAGGAAATVNGAGRLSAADAVSAQAPVEPVGEALLTADAPAGTPDARLRAQPAAAQRHHGTPSHFGRYTVKGRLESCPSGAIYDAWDPARSCPVAIRTVQPQPDARFMADPHIAATVKASLEQRVLQAARAAVGCSHPHILTVLDAGHSPWGLYIATERLQGRDMQKALAQGWRPRPSLAALIMRRVAEALAHAHDRGLVHGDIKPANIFLDEKVQPRLLNFGLAQVVRSQSIDLADTTSASLQYLAPEQLPGGIADARTDIRAVGVVLYELLAMAPAFGGKSGGDVARAVLANRPKPIHELRTNSPRSLAAIASRAMATDPQHRFSNGAELARALAAWSDQHADRKLRQVAGTATTWPGRTAGRRARAPKTLAWVMAVAVGGSTLLWLLMPVARTWLEPLARSVVARAAAHQASNQAPHQSPHQAPYQAPYQAPHQATHQAPNQDPTSTPSASSRPDGAVGPSASAVAAREAAHETRRFGIVSVEVSPIAQVSVNGVLAGTTPPLTQLKLPVGRQAIVLRSEGFNPYHITVHVVHDQPVELRHRFTR